MVTRIHHVTIVVADLDAAVERYCRILNQDEIPALEALPDRGVRAARFKIGESWLVLVQPTRSDGEPARHLAEHGEGVMLVSLGVDDLEATTRRLARSGISARGERRQGLGDWTVLDLEPAECCGAPLQLTESAAVS